MAIIAVISSDAIDRVAHILVRDPDATMANAGLLRWYSKAATFGRGALLSATDDLLSYATDGLAPNRLATLVSDFPGMFAWFGRDIARSEKATNLLNQIRASLAEAPPTEFVAHGFCEAAVRRMEECRALSITEALLGLNFSFPELRLVVVRDLWDPFFVLPNTVVCFQDDTFATYVAMVAHETTHMLSLSLVNDPEVTAGIPPHITHPMAEALAQAVQMLTTEACGISYGALFPDGHITDHASYLCAHPERARMKPMIVRMMDHLRERRGTALSRVYRKALEEFAGEPPSVSSSSS